LDKAVQLNLLSVTYTKRQKLRNPHVLRLCLRTTPSPQAGETIQMTKLTHSAERLPELLKLPILWTHSYFISTAGHVPAKTIHEYVEMESRR